MAVDLEMGDMKIVDSNSAFSREMGWWWGYPIARDEDDVRLQRHGGKQKEGTPQGTFRLCSLPDPKKALKPRATWKQKHTQI